jgi:hypothetical protein
MTKHEKACNQECGRIKDSLRHGDCIAIAESHYDTVKVGIDRRARRPSESKGEVECDENIWTASAYVWMSDACQATTY